jgi:phenylacetate-CoA ligase
MPIRVLHLARQLAAQWSSPEVVQDRQLALLQRLVHDSYTETTAWRCLMQRAGVIPDDIRTLRDIERLPVVRKEDLLEFSRDDRTNHTVAGADHSVQIATSGSSGVPFQFDIERPYDRWRKAQYLRPYVTNGRHPWHSVLRFTALLEDGQMVRSRRRPFPERQISSASTVPQQIAELRKRRPIFIQGYPSGLRCLAFELAAREIRTPYVRSVFTDSELLTPDTRAMIEQAFGAPVLDVFGSFETDNIGYQCSRESDYHVTTDSVIAEALSDGEPVTNQDGDLVVTVLRSRMTPFIRYNLRDRVRLLETSCTCGRTFPLMRVSAGRSLDLVLRRDGKLESPASMSYSMMQVSDFVREYQIAQTNVDSFTVRVAPARPMSDAEKHRIIAVINLHYPDAKVVVEAVEKVTRTPAAKLKAFVSELPVTRGTRNGN